MHRIRVYVDTSVFGGVSDEEFADPSRHFFDRVVAGHFVVLVSRITADELAVAPVRVRQVLDGLPETAVERVSVSPEAKELASAYLEAGVLGPGWLQDAAHVAIASVCGADLVLSWNFKHLVNFERIRKFNAVNLMHGYKALDIRSPRELVDDEQDEDL